MDDLENRFAYHKPKDQTVGDKHSYVRSLCYELAKYLDTNLPDGREKSLAITHLEEVMMWANASIARNN